jgi:hypothetical protein
MSANTSRRGIDCSLCYARLDPQGCTAEEILDGPAEDFEGGHEHRRPNNKNEIPSRGYVIIDKPDSFTCAAFSAITIMSFAKLLAHDKAAASATRPILACIED